MKMKKLIPHVQLLNIIKNISYLLRTDFIEIMRIPRYVKLEKTEKQNVL